MTTDRSAEYLASLVRELCKLPHETEWLEFKVRTTPTRRRSASICRRWPTRQRYNGKAFAYLVWGVEDRDAPHRRHPFRPAASKKGNEPLESWLLRLLTPKIHFRFHEVTA